jgi:hypothetical protein
VCVCETIIYNQVKYLYVANYTWSLLNSGIPAISQRGNG